MLPPLRWNKFRQNNRKHIVIILRIDLIDIAHDWAYQRTIWRIEHLQWNARAPARPFLFDLAGMLGIQIDIQRGSVIWRDRFGEFQRRNNAAMNARDQHQ